MNWYPTTAENHGGAKLSYKKFYQIRKWICTRFSEKFFFDMQTQILSFSLMQGDTQPAVVCSTDPLLIAAYSDEFDAVILLSFPKELAETYALTEGMRLVTSNTYSFPDKNGTIAPDIFPGPGFSGRFVDFTPVIQLFWAKKDDAVKSRVSLFDESHWQYAEDLARKYSADHKDLARDGFFYMKKR